MADLHTLYGSLDDEKFSESGEHYNKLMLLKVSGASAKKNLFYLSTNNCRQTIYDEFLFVEAIDSKRGKLSSFREEKLLLMQQMKACLIR